MGTKKINVFFLSTIAYIYKNQVMYNKPTEDFRKSALGNIGEKVVGNYYSKLGSMVLYSEDTYDEDKDLMIDYIPTQVKTKVPVMLEKAFCFSDKEMASIMRANQAFIVTVPIPTLDKENEYGGYVYKLDIDRMTIRKSTRDKFYGQTLIEINQPAMKRLFRIEDEKLLKRMMQLSTSKWN